MRPDAVAWLRSRGQQPFEFQQRVWRAIAEGRSGLLHATTGAGKTWAVWLGALAHLAEAEAEAADGAAGPATGSQRGAPRLTVLWITPMRALAADTLQALQASAQALAPDWTLGSRTGDTAARERMAQSRRLPTALVTTPESLSLLLARADAREQLGSVRLVVVDEWHELIGSKRGVQLQLALARLASWQSHLQVWGLSATLGNLAEALATLVPLPAPGSQANRPAPVLVEGGIAKVIEVDTLLPPTIQRFAWGGHMGVQMVAPVAQAIEQARSTLVFTNVRSQAERWYQALLAHRPDWAGSIALHHGSLDLSVRQWVEQGLKDGTLRAVVCTSSLDLGVDFQPVERVLQIGSAKGVARLLQRAGRSGHAPGRASRITLVPTHSLELVEAAAARRAVQARQTEERRPPHEPMDVLVQHLVTVALGGGFEPEAMKAEVRRAPSYAQLSDERWQWALDFVRHGGSTLAAYPDFQRVVPDAHGIWRVPDARLARRHRSNIGTIVSEAAVNVVWAAGGGRIGSVEESFIARLRPGDVFQFAGRKLELVQLREMTAHVRVARGGRAALPRWMGARMALSSLLADSVLRVLAEVDAAGAVPPDAEPELLAVAPLLDLQRRWSHLPTPARLLAETHTSREGTHLFIYPFAGRLVHIGLGALIAWRAAQQVSATFSIAINDYGIELLTATPVDWSALLPMVLRGPVDGAELRTELLASMNAAEMERKPFREIARIAGLVFRSHPGEQRSTRQLQASSSLYYEVFRQHDPHSLLLRQAREEVLEQEVQVDRIAASLQRMRRQELAMVATDTPTPLGFPLMVARFREQLGSESLAARIERMLAQLERRAGPAEGASALEAGQVQAAMGLDTEASEGKRLRALTKASHKVSTGASQRGRRPRGTARRPVGQGPDASGE